MSDPRRLLIVDDHPAVRWGLGQIVDAQPDLAARWEAGTTTEAIDLATRHTPELVLMDLTLAEGGTAGLELIGRLRRLRPEVPILAVSMHDERLYADRALAAGAHGYVTKRANEATLLKAMRTVLAGDTYLSDAMKARGNASVVEKESQPFMQRLTDRELEVFRLMGDGFEPRHIAEKFSLSPKTVNTHQRHLKQKLGAASTSELRRYAIRWVNDR